MGPDPRPRLAVVDFEPEPGTDERDTWIPLAFEELLARRLRRVPDLTVIPPIRLHQARRELQQPGGPLPPWPEVVQALGATHVLIGRGTGPSHDVVLKLSLGHIHTTWPVADNGFVRPGRFADVLDISTRWVLEQLKLPDLPDGARARVFAPLPESLNAVESYARAVGAFRADDPRAALQLAGEAVSHDPRFRPALGLLAQLELQAGPEGLQSAARHLRYLNDMARAAGDDCDRANAELALSLLHQAEGFPDAARTRADTAQRLAGELRDVYAEVAALSWLADLHVTWPAPTDPPPAPEAVRGFQQAKLREAVAYQRALLKLLGDINDRIGALPAMSKLALMLERLEDPQAALEAHKQTLKLAMELGSRRHTATAWLYLGEWYRKQSRWDEAVTALEECLDAADETTRPQVRVVLGNVYFARGSYEKALAEFQQAYEKLKDQPDLGRRFVCLREMARTHAALGQTKDALAAFDQAIELARALELSEVDGLRAERDALGAGPPR